MKNRANTYFALIFIMMLFLCTSSSFAQSSAWRNYLEHLAEEDLSPEIIDNMYNDLEYYESNPLNLNSVTKNELERFPLITMEQAAAVFEFLERNRPVYSVFELRNVYLLDFKTVELILPFFVAEKVPEKKSTLENMLKRGKNELQLRMDKTLNKRAGYGNFSEKILEKYPNRKYQGEDLYTSMRYSFSYKDRLQLGFTAEKDAGEPSCNLSL